MVLRSFTISVCSAFGIGFVASCVCNSLLVSSENWVIRNWDTASFLCDIFAAKADKSVKLPTENVEEPFQLDGVTFVGCSFVGTFAEPVTGWAGMLFVLCVGGP
jgi:hypothetical protein